MKATSLLGIAISLLLFTSLSASPAPMAAQTGLPIRLRTREFVPEAGFPSALRWRLVQQASASGDDRVHALAQFDQHPTAAEREQLAQAGLRLLRYVPERAWYVSLSIDWLNAPRSATHLRAITPIEAGDKLSPRLAKAQYPLRATVATYPDVTLESLSRAVRIAGGLVEHLSPAFHYLRAVLPDARTAQTLARLDAVFWLDVWTGPFAPKNDGSRDATRTSLAHASGYHGNPSAAPGSIVIGVWDCGWIESNHPGFAGRLTIGDSSSTDNGCGDSAGTNDHATHVGGTAAGSGAGSPAGRDLRGHADQAVVLSYDVNDASQEVGSAVTSYGLDISQNSWGPDPGSCDYTVLGVYDETAAEFDAIVRGIFTKTVNVVFANGNEQSYCANGWRTSSGGAIGKNVIAVGATHSDNKSMTDFSSFGPTEDGRVNPTIVAPGCESDGESAIWSALPGQTYGDSNWCGTSMAAPAVSGILGLMLEAHNQTYGLDPLPATLRAALIHTAEDLGNPGPDYQFGYGHVDAMAAINLITATVGAGQSAYIITNTIDQGQTHTYTVSHNGGSLKCTLVWDDEPAAVSASSTLVNDLDLALIAPDSAVHYPWVLDKNNPANLASQGVNHVDTIEQVSITNANAGLWQARVTGSNVPQGPQRYSLVCPFNVSSPSLNPVIFVPVVLR